MKDLSVLEVSSLAKTVKIVDVRQPDEFIGELGHIEGAELKTLGPDLEQFLESASKDEEIVFVCRSGGRSGAATEMAKKMGFRKAINMVGGMLAWNKAGLPVNR